MSQILIVSLLFSAVRLATPLLLAALGGLYSERSGVINIALEGLMLAGAFTAAVATHYSGNPWVGLLAAVLGWTVAISYVAASWSSLTCYYGYVTPISPRMTQTVLNQDIVIGRARGEAFDLYTHPQRIEG